MKDTDSSILRNGKSWAIACWLCNSPIPVKFTKKDKVYLICDNCGVQTFLRYGKAEELLVTKIEEYYNGNYK